MRKALVVFLVLLLVPALFVTAADKKKLTFWYPAGDITATSLPFRDGSNPWARFEADNNAQVEVVAIDYDTMQQKLFTALAGGKAPDIGMIDFSWMGGFIKDGALVAIPAADAKAWMSSVSPETVAISDWGGGKMYGFSTWGVDAYALTWNKTMFKDAGLDPNSPPKYWADFRAASKKTAVTDSTGKITRVGYAMRHTGQPHGIVDKWHWLLVGAGMQLNSDQFALTGGTAKINTPDTREGLQMAHDMVWVDKSSSLDFPDPRQALLSKIASMQISELVSIQLRQPKEAPDLVWGFAPPPAMRPGIHTQGAGCGVELLRVQPVEGQGPRAQGGGLVQQQGQRLRAGEEVQLHSPLQGQLGARAVRFRAEHQGVPRPAEVRDHLPAVPRPQRHPGCGGLRGAEDPPQRGNGCRRPGAGRAAGQRRHQGAAVAPD